MDSSDIISIIAVGSTLIISVVSLILSFRINKINLVAKRSEIAFGKRLEAFRAIVEAIGDVKITFANYKNNSNESTKHDVVQAVSNYYRLFRSQRVFLPRNIEIAAHQLGTSSVEFSNLINREDNVIRTITEWIIRSEPGLIALIEEFIGPK